MFKYADGFLNVVGGCTGDQTEGLTYGSSIPNSRMIVCLGVLLLDTGSCNVTDLELIVLPKLALNLL